MVRNSRRQVPPGGVGYKSRNLGSGRWDLSHLSANPSLALVFMSPSLETGEAGGI